MCVCGGGGGEGVGTEIKLTFIMKTEEGGVLAHLRTWTTFYLKHFSEKQNPFLCRKFYLVLLGRATRSKFFFLFPSGQWKLELVGFSSQTKHSRSHRASLGIAAIYPSGYTFSITRAAESSPSMPKHGPSYYSPLNVVSQLQLRASAALGAVLKII